MDGEFQIRQPTSTIDISSENEFAFHGLSSKQCLSTNDFDKQSKRNLFNEKFICDLCKKVFRSKFLFEKHSRRLNCKLKNRKPSCEICGNKLGCPIERAGDKPLACDTCKEIFFNNSTLHEDTGDINYTCHICKKFFLHKIDFKRHLRTHIRKIPYSCKVCLKYFTTKTALSVHYLTHNGEKPYTCDICGKKFRLLGSLKYHSFFVHNGPKCPKLHICHICGSSFKEKGVLLKHKLIHKKSLKRSYVNSSFAISTKNSLNRVCCDSKDGQKNHLNNEDNLKAGDNIHSKCKSFTCHSCQQEYLDEESFRKHFESTHTTEVFPIVSSFYSCGSNSDERSLQQDCDNQIKKKIVCDICEENFDNSDSLKIHFKIHTEQKYYVCEVCQLCFIDEHDLREHENIEKCVYFHTCKVCGEKFVSKIELDTHCRTHVGFPNERNFSCSTGKLSDLDQPFNVNIKSVSEKGSILTNNQSEKVYSDVGSLPYYCELCNKNFANEDNLNQHSALHIEEKSHVCELCQETFDQKLDLDGHVCIHKNNEKNSILFQALQNTQVEDYICRLCLTSFRHRHEFEYHMFQHTKEHECKTCGKRFFTADNLALHCSRNHKPTMHPCIACKEKFLNKKDLIAHCFSHLGAGEYFICSLCKQCFKGREDLQKHNASCGKTETI